MTWQYIFLVSFFWASFLGGNLHQVQSGTPVSIPNFIYPNAGCEWMGVGGQAWDSGGNPVVGLVVQLGGDLEGNQISLYTLTGSAVKFGESGYEFTLTDHVVDSRKTLYLQLFNLLGEMESDRYYFDTYQDCSRNLTIVNWVE